MLEILVSGPVRGCNSRHKCLCALGGRFVAWASGAAHIATGKVLKGGTTFQLTRDALSRVSWQLPILPCLSAPSSHLEYISPYVWTVLPSRCLSIQQLLAPDQRQELREGITLLRGSHIPFPLLLSNRALPLWGQRRKSMCGFKQRKHQDMVLWNQEPLLCLLCRSFCLVLLLLQWT